MKPAGALAGVIPCYNAGPAVLGVIAKARRQVHSLLVVDDGSEAATAALIQSSGVPYLRFAHNRGKGHAIVAGLSQCLRDQRWQAVVVLDADGQHDPDEIPTLRRAWEDDLGDIIIGARTGDWSQVQWQRRWANRLSSFVLSRLCRQPIPDSQSGFRLLARPVVERLVGRLAGGRYETESELLLLAAEEGFRIANVSVIDGTNNTVSATITVGTSPRGVGVNATTNRIYVANNGSNTVSVIDGTNNTVSAAVTVGANPDGVGVNATTTRIYVANSGSSNVSVIQDTAAAIPTLPQWGTILLTLSLLTLATWELAGRPALLRASATGGVVTLAHPRQLLSSLLVGQAVAAVGLVLYAGLVGPLVPHDALGGFLAGVLLGLMVECYRRSQ